MKIKHLFIALGATAIFSTAQAQLKVGGTPGAPAASVMLEVNSGTGTPKKGFLGPQVALTGTGDNTTVATPATGLMVYNTTPAGSGASAVTAGYYMWDGTQWVKFNTSTASGIDKNIYEGDGTLTSNRIVNMDAKKLAFTGGTTSFSPPNSASELLIDNGNAGTNLRVYTGDTLELQSLANPYQLTLLPGGNVGVGTKSPESKLHIEVPGGDRIGFQLKSATTITPEQYLESRVTDGTIISAWGIQPGINPNQVYFGSNSSNSVSIRTNAQPRITVATNGNVGIGNTAPGSRLDVVAGAGTYGVSILGPATSAASIPLNVMADATSNNTSTIARVASNVSGNTGFVDIGRIAGAGSIQSLNTSAGTSPLVLNPIGGSVGIGRTIPSSTISTNGSADFYTGSSYTGSFLTGTSNVGGVVINTTETDAFVGMQRPAAAGGSVLHISRDAYASGVGFITFFLAGNPTASITANSATSVSYNVTSDQRLKENIRPSSKGLSDVMRIQVRDYNYKADKEKTPNTGFLAQQLYTIFPQAVTKGGDDEKKNPWQVDYSKVTPLLVKAIQEQQAQIEVLKKENISLKSQSSEVASLRSEMDALKALILKGNTGQEAMVKSAK